MIDLEIGANLLLFLVIFFVTVFHFLKVRMRHKQIMAAIEKDIPLSQLEPAKLLAPRWISNLTFAVAAFLLSPILLLLGSKAVPKWQHIHDWSDPDKFVLLVPFIAGILLICISIACFIRAFLLRKYDKKTLLSIKEIKNDDETKGDVTESL